MSFDLRIPLSDLDYGAEEEAAVLRVLESRWLSAGAEVEAFEQEFAAFVGARHAVAVSSATAALHLSYLALGLGPGDEVIQPAINFVAAANMTLAVGATPVFADIVGLSEPTIEPEDLERRVTASTRAIVTMHYGGYFSRMKEIETICARHGLALIEDACHAVGARYLSAGVDSFHGRMAGNLGDVSCFSFFSNKNLATGEGGMVTTNRDDVADRVRRLRSHGMTTMSWDRHRGHASSYDVVSPGFNYRIDEIRGALGRTQLRKLHRNNAIRARLTNHYRRRLGGLSGWILPFEQYIGESAHHLMVVVSPDEMIRTATARNLRERGIQTSVHYPCITNFHAYQSRSMDGLVKSQDFASRALTLPLFPTMRITQVDEVCDAIWALAASVPA